MSETSTPDPGRNPVCQAESLYRGSRHRLPVRRPNFAFDDSIPRHWIADNAVIGCSRCRASAYGTNRRGC